MNRPPLPHIMGNPYHNPRPYYNQWSPHGPRPQQEFHWRPNQQYRPIKHMSNENNNEHWCETCDRGFPTLDQLNIHKQQHQKCNIDGCQFIAHPKVITKHIQMQHSTGLYKKISKLDNPEEIQKWREERKKKYPTIINIEKKAAECKEKIERGEKMALKQNRSFTQKDTDNRQAHPAGTKRQHSFDKNNYDHRNKRPNVNQRQNQIKKDQPTRNNVPKVAPKVPSIVQKNKLLPFSGILSICIENDDTDEVCDVSDSKSILIEDDYFHEEPVDEPIEKPIQEPVRCGALTMLMCDYGSSDEEINESSKTPSCVKATEVVESNNDKIKLIVENAVNDNIKKDIQAGSDANSKNVVHTTGTQDNNCEQNSDNDSGPEEIKTVKSTIVDEEPRIAHEEKAKKPVPQRLIGNKSNISSKNNHTNNNTYKRRVPSTLLQKLLHNEIRHERNIVLQCIRYIKKMDYFDKKE